MPFESLRGFRDYPPPEAGARSELLRRMRAAARLAGFTELEVPSIENLDLYRAKSGAGIVEQLWAFRDKGDREVALTPETTPSLVRVFAERAKSEPLPVKWFTVSKLWRYEEPQAGRTREFTQFNLDILGAAGIEADAEILLAAALVLDAAGAEGLYAFRLNDRALAEGIGRAFGAEDTMRYFRAVDRYRKLPRADFLRDLEGVGVPLTRVEELASLIESGAPGTSALDPGGVLDRIAALTLDTPAREGMDRVRRLLSALAEGGLADRVVFDPSVVRGLDYYTSTVFEAFAREGDSRSLFGGGRYDRLVELFGGTPTPAVGLAIGDQTLELLLRGGQRWPEGEPKLDTYVVAATPEVTAEARRLVGELRRAGVSADSDLLGRSMSRQLREAGRRARRALIVGPKELARGVVLERDLTSGAQREVARSSVARSA